MAPVPPVPAGPADSGSQFSEDTDDTGGASLFHESAGASIDPDAGSLFPKMDIDSIGADSRISSDSRAGEGPAVAGFTSVVVDPAAGEASDGLDSQGGTENGHDDNGGDNELHSDGLARVDTGRSSGATTSIRSSVVSRIVDNDARYGTRAAKAGTVPQSSKFYYSEMYSKLGGGGARAGSAAGANGSALSDFEAYSKSVALEDRIRQRVDAKRSAKLAGQSNTLVGGSAAGSGVGQYRGHVLTTLNIDDLDEGYIRPADSQQTEHVLPRQQFKSRRSPWLKKMFGSGGTANRGSRGSGGRTSGKSSGSPLGSSSHDGSLYTPSTNGKPYNTLDGSSVSTSPIDDDDGLDSAPIELDTHSSGDRGRDKDRDNREHHHRHSRSDSVTPADASIPGHRTSSIDIVVSNDDNLDYNLHPIDDVFDPEKASQSDIGDYYYQQQPPRQQPQNMSALGSFWYKINPVNTIRRQLNHRYQIQRKLKLRHLHQIALGGTLGVGLLLSSGKAFSIAGPLGCLLGFIISGSIVLATMLSFCEMVTLIPLCGGVSGVSARFVDDAFGFALGVAYWFSYMISLPTEITAAAIMLSFYPQLDIPGSTTYAWITLFLVFVTAMNLCDIRVYGELEYVSTIIKLLFIIALMIYNIILNLGGSAPLHERTGFKYWDSSKSDLANHITYGPFRPTFDVYDQGLGALNGIGGGSGRLCQVLIATIVAAYAYVGTEIVIVAGSEARNPRRAIPSATSNIYWRILLFYVLSIFVVGLNVYAGDPRLLRYFSASSSSSVYESNSDGPLAEVVKLIGGNKCKTHLLRWASFSNGNQSPFVIALQSAGLCSFAAVTNGFLLYFAVTAATSQLYASSRTMYFMAVQGKAPKVFSVCSKNGVPYLAVLFTAMFGCLAFLCVNNNTALVFERLLSVCASTGLIVWSGMCLSFIRFFYGLKMRPDIICRDDENYPYRSPFQPYMAYFGCIGAFLIVVISGFVPFFQAEWNAMYFVTCYGSVFLFLACYIFYKVFRRTKVHRLDQLDLDSGRREIDRIIWEDERNYASNFKEIARKLCNLVL